MSKAVKRTIKRNTIKVGKVSVTARYGKGSL